MIAFGEASDLGRELWNLDVTLLHFFSDEFFCFDLRFARARQPASGRDVFRPLTGRPGSAGRRQFRLPAEGSVPDGRDEPGPPGQPYRAGRRPPSTGNLGKNPGPLRVV